MLAALFIALLVVAIFVSQMAALWWRENAWRRRWRWRKGEEDEREEDE
jgi:hypothetical protein